MSISNKAPFITFEGIDGSGKSTQAKLLVAKLNSIGKNTVLVREPGGTQISEAIRNILLPKYASELTKRAEALLMTASRAQLTEEKIIPLLQENNWVIADRFTDSTLAYQGGGRGIDLDWLISLNHFATGGLDPDLTFYIDISNETGSIRRKNTNPDHIERAGDSFQMNVRTMYLKLIERFPNRIVLFDGNEPIDSLHKMIWDKITETFNLDNNE